MQKLLLRLHATQALTFAITLTALLISPQSLFLQVSSFSLSLDMDSAVGDQGVTALAISSNQDVSIQIFGRDVQNTSSLAVRFAYDATQVIYEGVDGGQVLPNAQTLIEQDSTTVLRHGTSFVEISLASLDEAATVNTGLLGTLRFRTTDAFSDTEIRLVRSKLDRDEQSEIVILALQVALQGVAASSPDFDGSGVVDFPDFLVFVSAFGSQEGQEKYDAKYDLDSNGKIAFDDFLIFISSFGKAVNNDINQPQPRATKSVVSTSDVVSVCDRTPQVRDAIVARISGVSACGDVTADHLASITRLGVVSRGLSALKAGDFSGLSALERLYLNGNQLTTVDASVFSGLPALETLLLWGNQFSELEAGVFSNLSALKTLSLSRNQFSTLKAGIFSGLTALQSVDLANNQLTTLEADVFSDLTALRKLDLSNNQFSTLNVGIFSDLSALRSLDLSNNQLTTLKAGVFSGLSSLSRLDLPDNQLTTLETDVFSDLSALTMLTMSHNRLSMLESGVFSGLTALTWLNLSHNRLSMLESGVFSGLTALEMLGVQNNAVDPLPITISLELVEAGQFKAKAHTGAPFDMVLPIRIVNGTLVDGQDSIAIPTGRVASDLQTVSRTPGTVAAVTVDIGALPDPPGGPTNLSAGYTLVKSEDLPLAVFEAPNQVPRFTSAETFTVTENTAPTTTVGTVRAEDADEDDNITGYGIVDGADGSQFEINDQTGVLTFKAAPNYESPADVAVTDPANDASNNEYIVFVTATGGTSTRALTVQATITVTVTDEKEPPSSPPSNVQVDPYDGKIMVTWDAMADEAGKPPITGYQVERRIGDNGEWEDQQTASGRTTTSLPYTGLTNGQEYQVWVRTVNDEGHSGWSDTPPATPNIIVAIGSIPEQTLKVNGGPVTIDLAPYFRYNREASDINYWATSQKVEVATETANGSLMTVTPVGAGSTRITARAGHQPTQVRATQRFTVTVKPANQFPTFSSISTALSVDENTPAGENIGEPFTATDADGDVLTYSLSGTDAPHFDIVSSSGQLRTKEGVTYDHEAKNSYAVAVDVDDGFGGTASIPVTITLNDLVEPPSSPPSNVQVIAGNGQLKVTWDAVTDEAGKPPISGYQVERRIGDNGAWEDLQEVSGRTTTSFIYKGLTNGQEYQVWVRTVNDEGHSGWSDTPSGTPIMRATNQAPTFSSTSATRSVDENTAAGQNIGDPVTATDGDNDSLTYSLSGTDANSFGIASSSGQLQTKAGVTYDYETKTSYSVVVEVDDGQGGNASIAVTITLNDVGEPPSRSPSNVQIASVGDGQLQVTWDAVTDEAGKPPISGYQVERRTGKRSDWGSQQTVSGRTTTSLNYTGLTNGQRYQVRVRTVNSDGISDRFSSSASFLDPTSRLSRTYRQFVKARQNDTEPTLPDFSYAGYHHFSKPVPDVKHMEYNVKNYGAIPDDDQSDQDAIVAAIAAAEANGSGIIFFPPGEFLVNTDADTTADGEFTPIVIRSSNIVLRGSGSRAGGTVIRQVNSMYKRFLSSNGGYHAMFRFRYKGNPRKSTSVTEDATRETFWITVANASKFKVGDWVTLKLEKDKAAIADFMGGFRPRSRWEISKRGVVVDETHRIAEIQNNRMRFHEPLHANVNSNYNWKVQEYKFLEEVGVEDISFHGSWTGDFLHHKNYIHDYSWYMLQFSGCVNSWVRRVSFINTSKALGINGSAISVYHVTIAGNQGHFSFVGNADHSWIGLSEDLAGPQHGPNIQGPRSGNVYYRYDYPASLDFHASRSGEPIATLFDRAKGGNLSGSSGLWDNWPHHLRHFVAYNFHQGPASQHYDFWNGTGQVVIKPIIVGFHGNTATFVNNTVQLNESQGSAVEPESLFDAQLELRLGTIPDWLKALRTEWETIRNTPLPNFLPPDRTPPVLTRITLQTEEESAGSYTGELNLIYNEKLNPVTEVPSDAYEVSIQDVQGAITIEGVRHQRENYLANNKNTVTIDLSWTAQPGTTFTARDVTIDYRPPTHVEVDDNLRVEDYGGTAAGSLMGYIFNTAPVFTSGTTFTVEENTQSVGTLVAEDGEDSITGYEVSGGADQAQFAITNSGALSFQTAPDHERPADGDMNNEYIVEVTATSGTNNRELTATQTITVTVTDKDDEKPDTPTAPAVSVSTLNSLTVTWTAPANTGPEISSYDVRHILSSASEQDKADDSNWTVVPDAWTSGALEHTIENLEQNKSYDVQVRATNADGTGDWSDSVAGVTGANQAPVFTSVSAVSVNENSTAVIVTVTATDADEGDSITGYAISGGADQAKFSIDSTTGALSFKEAPDYENPTDVASTTPANDAANNEYIVEVEATGGADARAKTVVQTITVTVTDENEKPVFADISPISVNENITVSVVTVSATDADTDDDIESYGIVDAADGLQFEITNGGVLTFKTAPNYESPADVAVTDPANDASNNEYIVFVKATGGTGARALTVQDTITVTVSDVDEAPVATGKIYWLDNGTDKIQRANLNGSSVEDLVTSPDVRSPNDIALDLSGSKMYWADGDEGKIRRADLDGNNIEDIITGLDKPTGIALDLPGNKVYWTDRGTDKIQRANLDGSNVEDLITTGLNRPAGIALDVSSSKMYWADRGTDKIQRANLDGTNIEDLVTSNLTDPMGIALDTAGSKMYWVDNGADKIQRANLDGSGVEDLVTGLADSRRIALDLSDGKMYWVDNGADKIQRANLDGTNIEDLITNGLGTPTSLALNILSAQTLTLTVGTNETVDVANYFSDPENAPLTYTALSSDESIATVAVMGSVVTIAPVASGTAMITVTASDGSLSVQQTFQVIEKVRAIRSSNKGESHFGVSTLAKTGESIGVILLKGNLAAIHHYVLEPTQEDHQQKAATFAIDEKTGEVRLKIEPAQWQNETYLLDVELLSQTKNKLGSTTVSIYKKQTVTISPTTDDIASVIEDVSGPATIAFSDGTYTDLGRIAFSKTGVSRYDTFEMRAINPGEVTITGNTVFDISGDHNVFHGFIFRDISSNTKIGRTRYPTPLTIRGDHNRFTECVFYPRSQGDRISEFLSTSLKSTINDKVARFLRIDHCAFINRAYILLDNTQFSGVGDGDGGPEQRQGTNNPISVRVDHNFFQNIEDSFLRLGRVGNRDSESIFDANLIAGNREGDAEHFVGKMGSFLWLNNTMEDCHKYFSLRMGGYAYIVHSYFLQRAAMSIIGWDRNHMIVGNYFRVNGRNTPEGNKPYIAVLRMSEGIAGPQGGHNAPPQGGFKATTDWRVAYNTFDAPADVPFVNFMGKKSRRAWAAEQLSEAQKKFQEGTYTHATPPEERYKFTLPINNRFIGNLFFHREAVTSKPQKTFSLIHYGVWEKNTFTSNLISSPVTEIYEHDTSNGNEENARQITQNLGGLTFTQQTISRDQNGLLITPIEIPQTFRVPNYNKLPIDPNAVIHKQKDNIIDKTHLLYKLMDLRDLGDKLDLNRPLTTRDVGPSWDWQSLYRMLHGTNPYEHNYQ